jgi:hypothetical protein
MACEITRTGAGFSAEVRSATTPKPYRRSGTADGDA